MDWSAFVPTLLATFAGVVLSVVLTFVAYWLWDWLRTRRQRAVMIDVLSSEVTDTLGTLTSQRGEADNVLNGERSLQTWCDPVSLLQTPAYDEAFKKGELRRLGDRALEQALGTYFRRCELYNNEMRHIRDLVHDHHGRDEVPPHIAEGLVRPRLPVIDALIAEAWELLGMMNPKLKQADWPPKME